MSKRYFLKVMGIHMSVAVPFSNFTFGLMPFRLVKIWLRPFCSTRKAYLCGTGHSLGTDFPLGAGPIYVALFFLLGVRMFILAIGVRGWVV